MKYNNSILFFLLMLWINTASAQQYLSDKLRSDFDRKFSDSATSLSVNYWRYDTCLNSKKICIYNTATGTRMRVREKEGRVHCRLSFTSQKVYEGKQADNIFDYYFSPDTAAVSWLIRTLCLEKKEKNKWITYLRKDSFALEVIDTLFLNERSLIRNVFDEHDSHAPISLDIYVLQSKDPNGSRMLHFWVERIGIIKLTDEKCWRYSFEIEEQETRVLEKLFENLYDLIKDKYKDPRWMSDPCPVEQAGER